MKSISGFFAGGLVLAAGVFLGGGAWAHDPAKIVYPGDGLAVSAIGEGRLAQAETVLKPRYAEDAQDPARLINLGIVYARAGKASEARGAFVAAGNAPECDLILSDGREVSSRQVARQQIAMLDSRAFATR
ncbi:tetratricopeptide repeat protein [Sphingobium sufflavum]|uniref:tetratricopeptide repeat protein n=1 Tax=Sphingobium sufflavum TaxID=1129547 RepID=UPI001F361AC7|nr:tetratricopeptide repeat protein [Sphingobium sufflavum]MCE7797511.1 tetratricopeptide repeat protein [Sphingobium sufflavum]